MNRRTALQEGVRDAIADPAGAANDQHRLTAEVELAHPYCPLNTGSRFSRKLATPSL